MKKQGPPDGAALAMAQFRRCSKIDNVPSGEEFVGTNIPGYQGRKLSVQLYRVAQKIYKFN